MHGEELPLDVGSQIGDTRLLANLFLPKERLISRTGCGRE